MAKTMVRTVRRWRVDLLSRRARKWLNNKLLFKKKTRQKKIFSSSFLLLLTSATDMEEIKDKRANANEIV